MGKLRPFLSSVTYTELAVVTLCMSSLIYCLKQTYPHSTGGKKKAERGEELAQMCTTRSWWSPTGSEVRVTLELVGLLSTGATLLISPSTGLDAEGQAWLGLREELRGW